MAYAKLVFPSGTFVLRKLKEIVRFATGQISSVSNLEFADQVFSEIVISDAPGWSLQAQSFESTGTATVSEYRLIAPCIDTSKNKCLRIKTSALGDHTRDVITSWETAPASTSTTGFGVFIMGSSWTSTTLNNSTGYVSNTTGTGATTLELAKPTHFNMNGSTIYVFSSQRKLIIFSGDDGSIFTYGSMLEFPETQHTIKHSNIPCLVSTSRQANADSPNKIAAAGTTIPAGAYGYQEFIYYYHHFFTNWYSPPLGTRANRAIWDYGINNVAFFSTPALNITSAGQTAYPLIPMTDIRTVYGEGIHNYSALTDMYITYRESAYTGYGDTIDVNGTDYVIMQVGTDVSNYRAFAIKKG